METESNEERWDIDSIYGAIVVLYTMLWLW